MLEKFKTKNAIAGLGAWLLSIASFTAQLILSAGEVQIMWFSPLGIATLITFILGSFLIYWSIWRREPSFLEKQAELTERKKYLQTLKSVVHKRLERAKAIRPKAIKLPYDKYYDKYLRHIFPYILTNKRPTQVQINTKLGQHKFIWNNLYYQELKDSDYAYDKLKIQYDTIYAQISDNKLKSMLNTLWIREHQSGSAQIYANMAIKNKRIPKTPWSIRGGLRGKNNAEKALNLALTDVENRIAYLLRGDDL